VWLRINKGVILVRRKILMVKKNDKPELKYIAGTKIYSMSTLGSMYDNHEWIDVTFEFEGKKILGRISTSTIMQMVNEFGFIVKKKVKYLHLEDPELVLDTDTIEKQEKYGFI
jgi:hypothetical protein